MDGDIKAIERAIFKRCDKDKDGCLTWVEMKQCFAEYGGILSEMGISLPTKEDFDLMAGEDGCLTFKELKGIILSHP